MRVKFQNGNYFFTLKDACETAQLLSGIEAVIEGPDGIPLERHCRVAVGKTERDAGMDLLENEKITVVLSENAYCVLLQKGYVEQKSGQATLEFQEGEF